MAKRKNTDIAQIKLRLVESLRKKLEAVAKAERRSLNSQIVLLLEGSLERLERLEQLRLEELKREEAAVRARAERGTADLGAYAERISRDLAHRPRHDDEPELPMPQRDQVRGEKS